ncbi:hypothetical protein L198_07444 [Cryptococcus wingfieldii CBS 7118]|uniref:RNI-like protein n=1 Tax=Cryptococcus wingfieldii CBS 7118 TaxID=1295528 RepID=A0A1E3IB82_9TREE|nr:hypothetical protein L198_07444 [Cryptococcus wingfieldii CBS 7118]ODN85879.1 hypothetical protein L198_07444 [Cryptococcus wingfieldii CBS 7118]
MDAPPAASPARRRPPPPTRGILKPPPPPAKPSLGNRLRDIVWGDAEGDPRSQDGAAASGGGGREPGEGQMRGLPTPRALGGQGGTLASLSGRLAFGFGRLVAPQPPATVVPAKHEAAPSECSALQGEHGPGPGQQGQQGQVVAVKKKQPLKKATFLLPSMSVTYPISSQGEPWSLKVLEDRQKIEVAQRQLLEASTGPEYWTPQRLVTLYEQACKSREERPKIGVVRALEVSASLATMSKADKSPLTRHSSFPLADLLAIQFGLYELYLEEGLVGEGVAGEDVLRNVLHGLLVSGGLGVLGLKGNRRVRSGGWRLVTVFLKKAKDLKYLDVSETVWDRKSIEYLVQSLDGSNPTPPAPTASSSTSESSSANNLSTTTEEQEQEEHDQTIYAPFVPPAPLLKPSTNPEEEQGPAALVSLRMDGCGLKGAVLEVLAQGIRTSRLHHISLRSNRISPQGAVAVALMIRDYPDSGAVTLADRLGSSLTSTGAGAGSGSGSGAGAGVGAGASGPQVPAKTEVPYAPRVRKATRPISPQPPPVPTTKPSSSPPIPQRPAPTVAKPKKEDSDSLPAIPTVSSTSSGGVVSKTVPEGYRAPERGSVRDRLAMPFTAEPFDQNSYPASESALGEKEPAHEQGVRGPGRGKSLALERNVKALEGVERVGRLMTLDLKGNDIRTGVSYIAQVLKRNRTLKVLNLSSNNIPPSGLVLLAEALKYNTTLETLDLSNNPCCSTPTFGTAGTGVTEGIEGVQALRMAFTINTSLKRLFLSNTNLTNEGAIALAEFLPESKSLLHLDLTENPGVGEAGVMALAKGLRGNEFVRCLDVTIPPSTGEGWQDGEKMGMWLRMILEICIRNTEHAAQLVSAESSSSTTTAAGTGAGEKEKEKEKKHGRSASHVTNQIWAPLKKSAVLKRGREDEEERKEREREDLFKSMEGKVRAEVYQLVAEDVRKEVVQVIKGLEDWLAAGLKSKSPASPVSLPSTPYAEVHARGKVLGERLVEDIERGEEEGLEESLSLNETLRGVLQKCEGFVPPQQRVLLPSEIVQQQQLLSPAPTKHHRRSSSRNSATSPTPRRSSVHGRVGSLEISSPNFSLGDSDEEGDSDAEEVDVGSIERGASGTVPTLGSLAATVDAAGEYPETPEKDKKEEQGAGKGLGLEMNDVQKEIERGLMEAQAELYSPSSSPTRATSGAPASPTTPTKPALASLDVPTPTGATLTPGDHSPVEKVSRAMVEEEGEIFRKGVKLGVVDDESEDEEEATAEEMLGKKGETKRRGSTGVSGEELRKEILETPVARSPTRRVIPLEGEEGEEREEREDSAGEE